MKSFFLYVSIPFLFLLCTLHGWSQNLRPFKDNKTCLYGYINQEGKWIVPPQYTYAEEFHTSYALVTKNERNGLIDTSGKERIPAEYTSIYYRECRQYPYYILSTDSSIYVFDFLKDSLFISQLPYSVYCYDGEYITFSTNNHTYGLALNNRILIDSGASYIYLNAEQKLAYISYEKRKKTRLYDLKTQRFITPDLYDHIPYIDSSLFIGSTGGYYSFISRNGKRISALYDTLEIYSDSPVIIAKKKTDYVILNNKAKKLRAGTFQSIKRHPPNFIAEKKHRFGVLDKNAREIVPFIYDSIQPFNSDHNYRAYYFLFSKQGMQVANDSGRILHNGYIESICIPKKLNGEQPYYGYKTVPDFVHAVDDVLIAVTKDSVLLIIDLQGTSVSSQNTSLTESVILEGSYGYGYLSEDLQTYVAPSYDRILPFNEESDYTQIIHNQRYGIMDRYGEIIVPPSYAFIEPNPYSQEYFIILSEDSLFGIINAGGESFIEPQYEEISGYDSYTDTYWARNPSESYRWKIYGGDGLPKTSHEFESPQSWDAENNNIVSVYDSINDQFFMGVMNGSTFEEIIPFKYENIAEVNSTFFIADICNSDLFDLYIYDTKIDSVIGFCIVGDGTLAIHTLSGWGFLKDTSWLIKPVPSIQKYPLEIRKHIGLSSTSLSSPLDYQDDLEIAFDSSKGNLPIQRLINNQLLELYLAEQPFYIEKYLYEEDEDYYYEEDEDGNIQTDFLLPVFTIDYVLALNEGQGEEEYYRMNHYEEGNLTQLSAIVFTPRFAEIRYYHENWYRANYSVEYNNTQYTIQKDSLIELSLADITNHLDYSTILSSLLIVRLDSMEDIQIACSDRENILELAGGYQFEKDGILFYFNDERNETSGYFEYGMIEVLLPYSELVLYFKNSPYIKELYQASLKP